MAVSRRKALRGGVAAIGAAVATAGATASALAVEGADAELIASCGQVIALEGYADSLSVRFADLDGNEEDENGETFDELNIANHERQQAVVARISSLPCRTPAGQRAIAECFARLQHEGDEYADGPHQEPEVRLLLALGRAVLERN